MAQRAIVTSCSHLLELRLAAPASLPPRSSSFFPLSPRLSLSTRSFSALLSCARSATRGCYHPSPFVVRRRSRFPGDFRRGLVSCAAGFSIDRRHFGFAHLGAHPAHLDRCLRVLRDKPAIMSSPGNLPRRLRHSNIRNISKASRATSKSFEYLKFRSSFEYWKLSTSRRIKKKIK